MTSPIVVPDLDRNTRALKAQLENLLALMRDDASSGELARIYAVCVTAYRAANLRASVVAQVPFRVVGPDGKPQDSHPLNALFRDNTGFHDLMLRNELTLCFWGHTLVHKQRMVSGRVTGLRWLNPQVYTLDVDLIQGLRGFRVWGGSRHTTDQVVGNYIPRTDAVYLHGVDFDNDFDGVSPAEVAFDQAGIETEAALTAVWFLRNRAVPAAILQPKDSADKGIEPPDEAARRSMRTMLMTILKGARNAGKTLISSGRWEWTAIQQQFDQIGLSELTDDAREAISMAFDVPMDLLLPTASTYAELFQSNDSWVRYFVKSRCQWYAGQFTAQLAPEFGSGVRLEPAFDQVFEDDERALTDVANAQLQGGYISLYDAQVKTNHTPDERLKDIYVISGQPVHVEALVERARSVVTAPMFGSLFPSGAPVFQPAGDPPPSVLPPQPPRPLVSRAVPAPDDAQDGLGDTSPDAWLPDDVYKELRDCVRVVARRGAEYAFRSTVLPVDVVALVRLLIATGSTDEDALVLARRHTQTHARKAYDEVEAAYRAALYDLIRSVFARKIGRKELGDLGRAEVSQAFEAAFKQGLRDTGVQVDRLRAGEAAFVREQAKAERRHWTALSNAVLGDLLPIQDQIDQKQADLRTATDPALQEQLRAEVLTLKRHLIKARDAFLGRLTLWTQGLRRIYSQGQLSGQRNQMLRWDLDPAKENCRSCQAAHGQVHRASDWSELDLFPGSDVLECVSSARGVPVCGCGFTATDETERGRLDLIPRFAGAKRSVGLKAEYGQPDGTVILSLSDVAPVVAVQDAQITLTPALDAVRWIPAAYLHVTLAHSPLVTADAFRDIFDTVVAQGVPSCEVKASRVDVFEDGDTRALVLLVEAPDDLRAFQRRVYDAFRARDIPLSDYSDPDRWQPHITLGYEESRTEFEPRAVEVVIRTGEMAFTRGDYKAEHVAAPGTALENAV